MAAPNMDRLIMKKTLEMLARCVRWRGSICGRDVQFYCARSCTTTKESNENYGIPIVIVGVIANIIIVIVIAIYISGNGCHVIRKNGEGNDPENEAEDLE
jgi:hypothetical protein